MIAAPAMRMLTEENSEAEGRFAHAIRIAEAMLFASDQPLGASDIARMLPSGVVVEEVLAELERAYRMRGVILQRLAGKWMFRTAPDLGYLMKAEKEEQKKLSRAAMEVLAIIAYHQPVTRAEIEDLRGVATHRGTLDLLLEAGFIRLRGRRRSPGRPVTFGTTEVFLVQFGLDRITDLPGIDELVGAGIADAALARALGMPIPSDDAGLAANEDPLEPDLFDAMAEERRAEEAGIAPLDPDGADVSAPATPVKSPVRPADDEY